MSMPYDIIRCEGCSEEWHSHRTCGLFKYCLPDGRMCDVDRTLSWCHDCRAFQPIEILADMEELADDFFAKQRKLIDALNENRGMFRWLWRHSSAYQERLQLIQCQAHEAAALLKWRDIRQSPPKCLACGSVHVEYVERLPAPCRLSFAHPNCGGALTVNESEIRIALAMKFRAYDVEGHLIEKRPKQRGD